MFLTYKQKEDFERDGYLLIPDFVSGDLCDKLVNEAERLVAAFDPAEHRSIFSTRNQEAVSNSYFLSSGNNISFFFEPDSFDSEGVLRYEKRFCINKMGHALHDLNPIFDRFSRQENIKNLTHDLGFEHPLLMQSMYIFKQPRVGGEVVCHQDSTFLFTEPVSAVGYWVALQDATVKNGCLSVLPGAHKTSLRRRFRKTSENSVVFDELDASPWPDEGFIPLEVKKGSLIILHGLLPHLSGPNTSDVSRHAYTLHVIEKSAHYPDDNWLQRDKNFPPRGFE